MVKEIAGLVYDCKNAKALTDFYVQILGWEKLLSGGGRAAFTTGGGFLLFNMTVGHIRI